MFDSIIGNMLTSGARTILAVLAGYLVKEGVLQGSGTEGFIAAGLVLVQVGWSWYEKVGHARLVAVMSKVPPAIQAEAAAKAGVPHETK